MNPFAAGVSIVAKSKAADLMVFRDHRDGTPNFFHIIAGQISVRTTPNTGLLEQ